MTEPDFTRERPCPCGAGTYTVATHVDDWNRHDESWTMRCERCRSRYALFEYSVQENGRNWPARCWVTQADRDTLAQLRRAAGEAERDALAHARSRSLDGWMALCRPGVTKRRLWEILTDEGRIGYPSLTTFYRHTRAIGLEHAWDHLFSSSNLTRVTEVLGIADAELDARRARAAQLSQDHADFETSLIHAGFV